MINSIEVSNFKAFSKKQKVKLKPITIIYGENSAGKSSLIQSLLLMRQTIDEMSIDDTALITKGKLIDLGNYNEMVFSHDKTKKISISHSFDMKKVVLNKIWNKVIHAIEYESIFELDINTRSVKLVNINIYLNNDRSIMIALTKAHDARGASISKRWRTTRNIRRVAPNLFGVEDINFNNEFLEQVMCVINDIREKRKSNIYNDELVEFDVWNNNNEYLQSINELDNLLLSESKKILFDINGYLIQGIGYIDDSDNAFSLPRLEFKLEDLLMGVSFRYRNIISSITYLGPLREYPERHYIFSGSSPITVGKSGASMSDMLFQNQQLIELVNKWLDEFQIQYTMCINKINDSDISDVYTMRLIDKLTNISVSPLDVGFGISQILPIIVESLISKNRVICVEQPEIHIHPKLQAIFGSFLVDCIKQKNQFIIETHSEHILLRLKKLIREKKLSNNDVSVIYILKTENGSKCLQIRMDSQGDFLDEWPNGFFEEGYEEVFY